MEYDRSRTRWSYIALYLLYAAGVIYLLMVNNRYLYSHRELRVALAGEHISAVNPIPKGTPQKDNGEPTYWSRANPERSNFDTSGTTRDREYTSDWKKDILLDGEEGDLSGWAADFTGIYLTGKHPWALALSPEGEVRWRFRFASSKPELGLLEPVTDQHSVYLAQYSGQIASLDKENGTLLWKLNLATEIASAPILINDDLWLVIKPLESEIKRLEDSKDSEGKSTKNKSQPAAPQYRFVKVDRGTGELLGYSNPFAINGLTTLTWARDLKQLLATTDNKLHSLNLEDGKTIITQTLPDPIKGPAIVAEGKVFVALASGKIQAWDLNKKGKFEWEVDLDSPPQGPPTYVPAYQRLSVLTADGNLHMIDLKKAELLWRFQLENRNPIREILATRLNGHLIERLSLKWEKKGWTIWAPCSENRLCIYNPDKGQLLARVPAPGGVMTPPLFVGKEFYLVTSEQKDSKHSFRLSHYGDDDYFKKKAAAKAAAEKDNK